MNIAHISQEANSYIGTLSGNHGRGNRFTHGCGRGRGRYTIGNWPTCQPCGKYGHLVITCWHCFNETFMPHCGTNPLLVLQAVPLSTKKPLKMSTKLSGYGYDGHHKPTMCLHLGIFITFRVWVLSMVRKFRCFSPLNSKMIYFTKQKFLFGV